MNKKITRQILQVSTLVLFWVFCLADAKAQTEVLSPVPPKQKLATSLPPQRGLLPSAPGGIALKQGYFPGDDGIQLFYRIVGDGPDTVVFIHGGPTGIEMGALDLEKIAAKGYTFISFDQRGGGRSELVRDSNQLSIINYLADVEALRSYFHIRKLSLIGCAWGAAVATFYSTAYPENVANIVFLSPINPTSNYRYLQLKAVDSILSTDQKKELQQLSVRWDNSSSPKDLIDTWVKQDSIVMTSIYLSNPEHYQSRVKYSGYPALALKNTDITLKYAPRSLGIFYDLRPLLEKINVPVLVIEGEKTKVALEASNEYVQTIKGAKLVLIPYAGHMTWLDQPETVIGELDKFYKSLKK